MTTFGQNVGKWKRYQKGIWCFPSSTANNSRSLAIMGHVHNLWHNVHLCHDYAQNDDWRWGIK